MRNLIWCVAVLAIACGDNHATPRDAAPEEDAPADGSGARTACIDRPTELPAAPTGELPCDLLPPGFAP